MDTKQRILYLLASKANEYVSGEKLSETLDTSRAYINKEIQALKKAGYIIDGRNNKGYSLIKDNYNLVSQGIIKSKLINEDMDVIYLPTVTSTNTYAKQLLDTGITQSTLVISNQQTAGRGRIGKKFWSPKDNIYMSIVLTGSEYDKYRELMTVRCAVAVRRAVNQLLGINLGIKWVNDMFLNGKKVCGILTERISDMETKQCIGIVVGIGINCTNSEDIPQDLKDIYGSLGNQIIDRNTLIANITNQFLASLDEQDSSIINDYKENSIVINKFINYQDSKGVHNVRCVDINQQGNLVVQDSQGNQKILLGGEISLSSKQFVEAK